jgi:tetratricopeptide (TPR) repeat protein
MRLEDALEQGQVALGGGRYEAAVAYADEALRIKPSAEARYIRARAEEDRPKPDANITAADLEKARADYQAALDLNPDPALAARCRSGLANVAFDNDDYATAVAQWTSAVDDLDDAQWRALALYKVGLAQQRLGQFADADKTLQSVRDQYPDQDVAARARERQGVRGFYVQLGTYTGSDDAATAIATAKGAGLTCRQIADQGLIAVRGGPFTTYAQAKQALAQVAAQFPQAVVGP